MGKTAANDRIRLRASFYNNLSISLLITGLLVPFLTFALRNGGILNWLHHIMDGTAPMNRDVAREMVVVAVTFVFALYFRRLADRTISRIED